VRIIIYLDPGPNLSLEISSMARCLNPIVIDTNAAPIDPI
jgi:hypothetical protein